MQTRHRPRAGSPRRGLLRRTGAAVATAAVVSALVVSGASAVQSKVPAAPNPALPDQCELDLAVSLDLSLSVSDSQLQRMKQEVGELAHALTDYPVRLAIHDFASNAPANPKNGFLPLTALAGGGAATVAEHVDGLRRAPGNEYYTNWDQAMVAVAGSGEDYHGLVLVTDGDPTRHGSPAQGSGSGTSVADITAAVRSANALKGQGTRVIGIGVSDNIRGTDLDRFREHMSQISGPVEGSDYHVAGFATLKQSIVDIVDASCAGVSLVKDAALSSVHDAVDYTFTATNTGSVTLTDVTITDPLPGLPELTFGEWPAAPGVLEPGESVSATARYPLMDGDFAAGGVENTATVTGTTPADGTVQDSDDADVALAPGITLVKDATVAAGAAGVAGDTVTYSFTATNSGNVTLTDVAIEDPKPGLSDVAYGPWPGPDGVLAPGQSVTATASYDLTQEDVDRGSVSNTATATGTPPAGEDVSADDSAEVTLTGAAPSISLTKDAALAAGAQGDVGDVVTYSFTATNTGDVTLTDVEIHDPKEGLYDFAYGEWPGADGVLAPGESVTATASYELTEADVTAGEVHNAATATGTTPSGPEVSDGDDARISLEPQSGSPEPQSGTGGLAVTGANAAGVLLVASLLLLAGAAVWTRARHA